MVVAVDDDDDDDDDDDCRFVEFINPVTYPSQCV